MRRFSHILSFVAVALFLLSIGSTANATGIDPSIDLGGSGSCSENTVTSLTQTFTDLALGCANDFTTAEGFPELFQLVVTISGGPFVLDCVVNGSQGPSGAPLTGPAFQSSPNSCTFTEFVPDSIVSGVPFSLTFDPAFGSPVTVTLSQTVIPEPATLFLLGTGLAALAAKRKRLKTANHLV